MKPYRLSLAQRQVLALASLGWIRRDRPGGRWAEVTTGSVVSRTVVVLLRLGLVEAVADGDAEIAQLTAAGRALLASSQDGGTS